MKKILLCSLVSFVATTCYGSVLLPGSKVYHLLPGKVNQVNDYPTFTGTLINLNTTKALTAKNYIKVPNHFPTTIAALSTADYSVTPSKPVGGFEQWTYPIVYTHGDGSICVLQFAWNPVTEDPDIGMQCDGFYPGNGTNIAIN